MEGIRCKIGFRNCLTVPAVGRASCLALLWIDDISVKIQSFSLHHVDAHISLLSFPQMWGLTGIYGAPSVEQRQCVWDLFSTLRHHSALPWFV